MIATEEQKGARMHEVWHWLVELGICDVCASTYALVQTEREMGDPAYKPWPTRCEKVRRHGLTCRQLTSEAMRDIKEATLWARVADEVKAGLGRHVQEQHQRRAPRR